MRHPIRIVLWAGALAIAGVTVLGMVGRAGIDGWPGWILDLLSHWPKQLVIAAFGVGVAAGIMRMRRAASVAIAMAAINGALLIGAGGFALPQQGAPGAAILRVVSANVHGSMSALQALADQARSYGADIVSVYEAPEELQEADLARLFPQLLKRSLPSERLEGRPLKRRSLFAARDADAIDTTAFMGSNSVVMRARVDNVQIVTTHPPSPGGPGERWDRDRQLASTHDKLDVDAPFVIMGDFNTTPWGHAYEGVPGTRAGDPRFDGTFPAFAGVFGLPIDHIRFGGGLVLTDYRSGPDVGSDHLPLFAAFALPSNSKTHIRTASSLSRESRATLSLKGDAP